MLTHFLLHRYVVTMPYEYLEINKREEFGGDGSCGNKSRIRFSNQVYAKARAQAIS